MNRPRHGQAGYVLLVVLGLVALLALVGTRLTSRTSMEARVASAYRDSAQVETAADSAIHEAVMHLMKGQLIVDARPTLVRIAGVPVVIHVTDEAAKLNPNIASPAILRSLLSQAGVDDSGAATIAGDIQAWRQPSPRTPDGMPKRLAYEAGGLAYAPSNRPFDTLDELKLVIGMTPAIFARIRPFLTLYTIGDVRLDGASPVVARAVLAARATDPNAGRLGFVNPDQVVQIDADATLGAARFTRVAVIRLRAKPRPGERPYMVLAWQQATD